MPSTNRGSLNSSFPICIPLFLLPVLLL
jgi:hypothetical protein